MWNIVGQLNELQKKVESSFEDAVRDHGDDAAENPPGSQQRLRCRTPSPAVMEHKAVDAFFDEAFASETAAESSGPSAGGAKASSAREDGCATSLRPPGGGSTVSSAAAGVAETSAAPVAPSAVADSEDMWGELDMAQPLEAKATAPRTAAGITETSAAPMVPSAVADSDDMWGELDMAQPLEAKAPAPAPRTTAGMTETLTAPMVPSAVADSDDMWGELDMAQPLEDNATGSSAAAGVTETSIGPSAVADSDDMWGALDMAQAEVELEPASAAQAPLLDLLGDIDGGPTVKESLQNVQRPEDTVGDMFADLEELPAISGVAPDVSNQASDAAMNLEAWGGAVEAEPLSAMPIDIPCGSSTSQTVVDSKFDSDVSAQNQFEDPDRILTNVLASTTDAPSKSDCAVVVEDRGRPVESLNDVQPGAAQSHIPHPLEVQTETREANPSAESSKTESRVGLVLGPPALAASPQDCETPLEQGAASQQDGGHEIPRLLESYREVAGDAAQTEADAAREAAADARETSGDAQEEEESAKRASAPQHFDVGDDGDDLVPRLRHWATGVYEIHNPSKLPEIPKIFDKYRGRELDLVRGIARKYGVPPPTELDVPETAAEEAPAQVSSWFQAPASLSISTDGQWFQSGLTAFQSLQETAATIQDKAGGLRENVERQFEEAIRSQGEGQSQEDAALPLPARDEPAPPQLQDSAALQALREMDEQGTAPEPVAVQEDSPGEADTPDCTSAVTAPIEAEQDATESSPVQPIVLEQSQPEPDQGDAVPDQSAALAARDKDLAKWKDLARGLAKELETVRGDHKTITMTVDALRAERSGLMEEGLKMSKRVQTVEAKMQKANSEARSAESRVMELQRVRDGFQAQVDKLTKRAEQSEATCNEQRVELKKSAAEVERTRDLLQGEQRRTEVEQQAQLQLSQKQGDRDRALEDKLEATNRERAELLATNSSLSNELQRALAMADSTESQYQAHLQEAEMTNEEQRRRIEVLEMEYASSSLPSTQRIASLEAGLARQEQLLGEREAAARRELSAARAELERERREGEARAEAHQRELKELHDKVQHSGTALTEATRAQSRAQEEWQKREAADRARELAEGELRLAQQRRASEETRAAELERQVADLKRQVSVAQQISQAPSPTSPADAAAAPAAEASQASTPQLEQESRRLRSEVEGLARQRDLLERDSARLQAQLESQSRAAAGKKANVPLETKFEAALQAIGKLQEALEASQDQRDKYKEQCQQLVQVLGRK